MGYAAGGGEEGALIWKGKGTRNLQENLLCGSVGEVGLQKRQHKDPLRPESTHIRSSTEENRPRSSTLSFDVCVFPSNVSSAAAKIIPVDARRRYERTRFTS